MNENKEDLLLNIYHQLSEMDKILALDFLEYLSNKHVSALNNGLTNRNHHINEIVSFLHSLRTKEFDALLWSIRGMQLVLEDNKEKRESFSNKWRQEFVDNYRKVEK